MTLHRRAALRLGAIGGGVSLVLACAPPVAPAPTAPPKPAALQLPTYVAFQGPPPDQPGDAQGVQPVYVHYPKSPVKSVATPPGKGSQVTALTNTVNAPPAPLDQNPAWQAVNQQIASALTINIVPASDYPAKLAATMAGSDLPDLLYIYQGGPTPVPSLLQFLQARCADLTPYLAGDGVKAYPNLANFPTYNWQGTGTPQMLEP